MLKNGKRIAIVLKARTNTKFIYNHLTVLDLIRSGKTRFATNYLVCRSVCISRGGLRNMFTSDCWETTKLKSTEDDRVVKDTRESIRYSTPFFGLALAWLAPYII